MLEIEIFSDAICPWCFIGKRRLEKALKRLGANNEFDPEVRLRWRPYLLYPNLPIEGIDRNEMLRRRYGPRGDKGRVPAAILAEAAAENIELRYDLIDQTPNTRAAHRLVEWVYEESGWQAQHALVETLFQAYFCLGQDVGDTTVLYELAKPFGLTQSEKDEVLAGEGRLGAALDAELDTQLERGLDLGVSGVPGYVMGGGYLLPGAQSVDTMQAIVQRAKTKFSSA
jgi:predicted DsbA family dithiol-disulfide isomerase